MSRAGPQMRDLAARLVAHETKENQTPEPTSPAVVHVSERLRPHLATLMGRAGFRAVLARALAVASTEVRWLAVLQVNAEGSLEGWDKPEAAVKPRELREGSVALVAQVLGLLVAFIGDNLTLRLLRDIWPKLALDDLKFSKGNHP